MFKKYVIDPFMPGKKTSARDRWQADEDEDLVIPANINLKETYVLENDGKTHNYVTADCCNPLPGDDVMGFLEDDGTVTVHSLTCPRAAVLKATYGSRILATRWGRLSGVPKFLATVRLEGIDRRGILREITAKVSTANGIDIRSFNIEATDEVFSGTLTVKVVDAEAVDELIRVLKEVNGVTSAARL